MDVRTKYALNVYWRIFITIMYEDVHNLICVNRVSNFPP